MTRKEALTALAENGWDAWVNKVGMWSVGVATEGFGQAVAGMGVSMEDAVSMAIRTKEGTDE